MSIDVKRNEMKMLIFSKNLFTRGKALIKSDNIKKKNPNLIQIGMDP
jgi:hypothetical protein